MRTRYLVMLFAATQILFGAGCASQSAVETDFGKSVHQMTEQQIYDMNAASSPDTNAVLGGDPDRLNNTLEGHRQDIAKPSDVAAPVTVNVGQQGQ